MNEILLSYKEKLNAYLSSDKELGFSKEEIRGWKDGYSYALYEMGIIKTLEELDEFREAEKND